MDLDKQLGADQQLGAEIKKATVAHVEELAQLFDDYRVWYRKPSDLKAAKAFLQARIEKEESVIFIAYNDFGEMAGFTQLYPLFSSTRMKRLWLLNDLFVHPDFRGIGMSKKLIERAKQLCRETNACAMILETEKSNLIGNELYPRTGFELDVETNHYEWTTTEEI